MNFVPRQKSTIIPIMKRFVEFDLIHLMDRILKWWLSKALAACKEALKCLARPPTGAEDPLKPNEIPSLRAGSNSNLLNLQKKTEKLHLKIDYLTRFVNARKSASSDFSDTVKICSDLLHKEPRESIALAIRIGDIYGLVIEGFFIRKETEKATELLREMLTVVPGDTIKYCKSFYLNWTMC